MSRTMSGHKIVYLPQSGIVHLADPAVPANGRVLEETNPVCGARLFGAVEVEKVGPYAKCSGCTDAAWSAR